MTSPSPSPDRLADLEVAEPADHAAVASGERGASLVEYALLLSFIFVVCVAAVALLGGTTAEPFSDLSTGGF